MPDGIVTTTHTGSFAHYFFFTQLTARLNAVERLAVVPIVQLMAVRENVQRWHVLCCPGLTGTGEEALLTLNIPRGVL